jgi:hypothetical protein
MPSGRAGSRLIALFLSVGAFSAAATRASAPPSPPGLEITDDRGRQLTTHGIELTDWEGFIANPAVRITLKPPPNAAFPASAIVTANGSRLHFDLPSETGAAGPRKEVIWQKNESIPIFLAIFPDRDAEPESYELKVDFTDHAGGKETLTAPIRVVDEDQTRPESFAITVDFSQDKTGFFQDADKRATVIQAARDWAYFFADRNLEPVAAGAEKTLIWGAEGFKSSTQVVNRDPYRGYLLYAYGIRTEPPREADSGSPAGKMLRRDQGARFIRSGGEPSPYGGFQVADGITRSIRRSGGVEIEIQGNYNFRGWRVNLPDTEWWRATNLGDEQPDLYSIAHHEIGHSLIFNPNNTLIKRGQPINDERVTRYLSQAPALNASDHLERIIDPASLHGAFGNEYHGKMPRGRWLITKLDLLCAQAIGYDLRETSAFRARPDQIRWNRGRS